MSPIPWPLIGRRDPYASAVADPVRIEPNVRIVPRPPHYEPPTPARHEEPEPEHAEMYRNHAWVRRETDVVLPRLAHLTEQYGPWEAARRLFADTPKGNPDV